MTIKDAIERYGVTKQAIYQRFKSRKIEIKDYKTEDGHFTPEGESLLEEWFGHLSAASQGDLKPQKEAQKQDRASFLQAQEEIKRLTNELDSAVKDIDHLQRELQAVKEERDFLRRALDQSQQLQAMTLRMLPPAPTEKGNLFSKLTARFKKPSPPAEQTPPSSDNL